MAKRNGIEMKEFDESEFRYEIIEASKPTGSTATVIKQSIKARSSVNRGTVIDVVLAVTKDLPLKVYEKAPKQWEEVKIGTVLQKLHAEPAVMQLMVKHATTETMTKPELAVVKKFVGTVTTGGGVVDPEAGYQALLMANTLGA